MKKVAATALFIIALLFTGVNSTFAQSNKAVDMFKNHINKVVQKVKQTPNPKAKRQILNRSFNNLLSAFRRVNRMKALSQSDQSALNELSQNIRNKKYELNGTHGYKRVPDNRLNKYANYVQQNIEQANGTITISVTVLLLIIILVVLLVAL